MSDQWQSRQRGLGNCRRGVSRKMGTPTRLCCRLTQTNGQESASYRPNHAPISRVPFVLFAPLGLLPPLYLHHAEPPHQSEASASGFSRRGGITQNPLARDSGRYGSPPNEFFALFAPLPPITPPLEEFSRAKATKGLRSSRSISLLCVLA